MHVDILDPETIAKIDVSKVALKKRPHCHLHPLKRPFGAHDFSWTIDFP
jgi:hypothetical protein